MAKLQELLKRLKAVAPCILIACLFLLDTAAYGAEEDTGRDKVKVGFFAFDGYHTIDEEGLRSGYGYDFLQMLSRYWDVEYEYIGYECSWEDMQEMLRNGEIDLVTSARITPERIQEFAFSKPIGTSSAMLTTRSTNETLISGDYQTYDGIRIGLLDGNSRNEDLKEFAEESNFSYVPVYYEMYTDLEQALMSGEVDAALTSSLRQVTDEHVLDYFAVEQFYTLVRKDDTELLNKLNYAIDQLDAVEGDWKNELNNKHYFHQEERNLVFTPEEEELIRQYAEGEKELVVSVCTDKKPYAYTEDGELKGILIDYFDRLADYVGVPYTTAVSKDRKEYLQWCDDENVANVFLDGRFANTQQMEEMGKAITTSYTTMYLARVTRRDFDGEINTLAVATSQGLFGIEDGLAPNAKRLEVETRSDAMQAVLDGKADAAFAYLYGAQQFVNQDERGLLTYTMLEKPTYDYHITFASNVDHSLAGIFTKAIYAMPAETIENIASEYTSYKAEEVDLLTWMRIHPFGAFSFVGILLFVIFLSLLLMQREKAVRIEQKRSAQLKELAELADSASNAKTTFLNNMSHDIRTPMNAIVGITTLMGNETGLSDQMQKYIQKVQLSSQYLLSLINDVLDMSKIEANEVELNENPFLLSEQISQLERIIFGETEQNEQIFQVHMKNLVHDHVIGDSVRLRQVLMNLLSNAVKYTQKGGQITLQVEELACEEENQARFLFTIADNGVGMSKELQEHIFEPFVRGENSMTNKIQGTGLGMPITKNLVTLMGGDIEIRSILGEGTTAKVWLKMREDVDSKITHPFLTGDASAENHFVEEEMPFALKGMRFLCAEDNELNAEILEALLDMNGASCTIYPDGAQLVAAFADVKPGEYDAILMDVQMPNMNGLEAARAIRAGENPLGRTIPILAMTANAFTEDIQATREAGMDAHLSKPIDLILLEKAIIRLCKEQ